MTTLDSNKMDDEMIFEKGDSNLNDSGFDQPSHGTLSKDIEARTADRGDDVVF